MRRARKHVAWALDAPRCYCFGLVMFVGMRGPQQLPCGCCGPLFGLRRNPISPGSPGSDGVGVPLSGVADHHRLADGLVPDDVVDVAHEVVVLPLGVRHDDDHAVGLHDHRLDLAALPERGSHGLDRLAAQSVVTRDGDDVLLEVVVPPRALAAELHHQRDPSLDLLGDDAVEVRVVAGHGDVFGRLREEVRDPPGVVDARRPLPVDVDLLDLLEHGVAEPEGHSHHSPLDLDHSVGVCDVLFLSHVSAFRREPNCMCRTDTLCYTPIC